MAISESTLPSAVPKVATDLRAKPTWIVTGSEVKKNGVTIKENYAPCLERIEVHIAECFLGRYLKSQNYTSIQSLSFR